MSFLNTWLSIKLFLAVRSSNESNLKSLRWGRSKHIEENNDDFPYFTCIFADATTNTKDKNKTNYRKFSIDFKGLCLVTQNKASEIHMWKWSRNSDMSPLNPTTPTSALIVTTRILPFYGTGIQPEPHRCLSNISHFAFSSTIRQDSLPGTGVCFINSINNFVAKVLIIDKFHLECLNLVWIGENHTHSIRTRKRARFRLLWYS